jgi:hypothetical protein
MPINPGMDLSVLLPARRTQGLLERARPHRARRLSHRECRVEAVAAVAFAAAAATMAVSLESTRPFPVVAGLALGAAFAIASRVRLYVGAGYAMPTQVVLVPMLFVLPVPMVPAVAGGALLLSVLADVAAGRSHPERALSAVADAWHVVGGALILALAESRRPASELRPSCSRLSPPSVAWTS